MILIEMRSASGVGDERLGDQAEIVVVAKDLYARRAGLEVRRRVVQTDVDHRPVGSAPNGLESKTQGEGGVLIGAVDRFAALRHFGGAGELAPQRAAVDPP